MLRVAVRKIPPSVTEEEFKGMTPIANILAEKRGSVQFYSAKMVGKTAGPAFAFAIVTLEDGDADSLISELENITFLSHEAGSKQCHPVIERAPIKVLPTSTNGKAKIIDIDNNPDFVEFAQKYASGSV